MATRKAQSKVKGLGVQDLVENLLEANATYDEIRSAVKAACGEDISDSSLSRYRQQWSSHKRALEEAGKRIKSLVEVILANPTADLETAGHKLIMEQAIKKLAAADLNDADALEVAHLFYKGARLQAEREAARRTAQAVDRPALYLDCLKEFTDYLSQHAPSALTALGETFDGFMDQIRKAHASQTAH